MYFPPFSPMTLDSWCSVLVPDLYLSICETFHCSPETDEEQVSLAMGQSLLFQPSALSSGTFDPNRTRSSVDYPTPLTLTRDGAHSPAVSTLWNRSAGDAVSGSVLAPYRDRRTVKSNELEAAAPTLADTRRGIKDLQIILMYELSRIAAIGYSSISRQVTMR